MKRLRFAIETLLFRLLLASASVVPRRVLLAMGAGLGLIGYHLDRRHTRIAMENLRAAYGREFDPSWGRGVVRACWCHFGRVTVDSIALYRMPIERVMSLVDFEGLEHARAAYARGGAIFFTGHFGNWELNGLLQGHLGMPLCLVARPLDNPELERMLARLRERTGNRVLHKRHALREILRAVRDGMGVAIVIDQDARDGGIFVPFFGRPASTTPVLGLVALRTGAPVVPSFSTLGADGRYRIVYEPPVEIPQTGDRDRDVAACTASCTAIVEKWVRRYPEMWLWMHRRWKTRPPAP